MALLVPSALGGGYHPKRYYTDSFNRPDATIGVDWLTVSGSVTIVSNELNCNGNVLLGTVYPFSTGAQFAQVDVTSWSYIGTNVLAAGVFVRANRDLSAYYMGQIIRHSAGGVAESWRIIKGSTGTVVAGPTASAFPATPYSLRIEASPAGHMVLVEFYKIVAGVRTLMVSYTDTSPDTQSSARMVGINGTTLGGASHRLDNFIGGTLIATL